MLSSIAKKTFMALTGLALIGFLVTHLLGNMLFFVGQEALDKYAHTLESNPMILIPAEIGLLVIFLMHLYLGVKLSLENKAARSKGYDTHHNQSSVSSRAMLITGLITFVFVVLHVWMFKFGDKSAHGDSLWALVINWFANPLVTLGYVAAMFFLGVHLQHAIASIFQSLGIVKPGKREKLQKCGRLVGWIIVIGFASIPVWALIFKPKPQKSPSAPETSIEKKVTVEMQPRFTVAA